MKGTMLDPERLLDIDRDLKNYIRDETGNRKEDCSTKEVSEEGDRSVPVEIVKEVVQKHQFDPNFSPHTLARAQLLLENKSDDLSGEDRRNLISEVEAEQYLELNDSPYTEVRSLVPPTDDPTIPVNTFRVWILGTVFVILGTGINEFFGTRYPGIWISSFVAQLVSYPCGVAMARYLPTHRFGSGRWSITLNPGPFSQKEHILIAVMSNVSFGNDSVYVTSLFTVLKLDIFFGEKVMVNSAAFRILLALSTQLLGYGCAGMARQFLVYPPCMIWPSSLAQIALNKALHNDNERFQVPGWKISRRKFMLFCFIGMFSYFWLPDYLLQALSFFNWTTWIAPNNVTLALVTGSLCGLGLNPWPTFDWNVITSLVNPIISPFFCVVNCAVGLGIACLIVAPLFYWNNVFNTAYLPITSTSTFDSYGMAYNVSRIMTPDFRLNIPAYEEYSAPYIGVGMTLYYLASFAEFPALMCHMFLFNWTELKLGTRAMMKWKRQHEGHNDVHNRLMKAYPEVPNWWFGIILAISFIFGCIVCACYPTGLPIWTLVLAIFLCLVLQIPIGMLTAITNVQPYTNVLDQLIVGFALPNRPIANMIFKAFGTMTCAQSVQFCRDLKLGHYLKIPPRMMFAAQVYASVLAVFVAVGVNAWSMINIKDFCQPTQSANFFCYGEHIFFSSAILWGVIGPKRLFGSGAFYNTLLWAFLVGAALPIPFWLIARRFPTSQARYVCLPLIIIGFAAMAPYNFSFIWPACIVGFVFNFYIKRHYQAWWLKYAYVLASSFSVAIALSAILIFFAVQFHDVPISWWGNNVPFSGVDGGAETAPLCLLKVLNDGEKMPGA